MKRKFIALLLLVAICASLTISAMASISASPIISRSRASLLANKTAVFSVLAKVSCDSLGTVRYVLYKSNGTVVKSASINDFGSGYKHSTTVDLSEDITTGNSYYVIAYFSADGETSNCTSGTRSY